jgi:DNA-binding NtrC family response regulator
VIQIELPPLRDRKEDIPLLVQHFVQKYSQHGGVAAEGGESQPTSPRPDIVSLEAMRRLMAFPWPGNVRQLENAVERAIALLGGRTTIDVTDLPAEVQAAQVSVVPAVDFPDGGVDLPTLVEQMERDLIGRALTRTGGNKAAAAGLLNLKRTTLVEKLRRLPDISH